MVRECARAFFRCAPLDYDELVASETEDISNAGRRFVECPPGAPQGFASGGVTKLAVHTLEMIDIDEHERHVTLAAARRRYGLCQPAVELAHIA
jgi:hypothetical protein